ncbi:hypothetical protein V9J15_01330 [Candidatus Liberibacter africanus]|uniref:hypothetical protein n=1 Tax=Liberibacter africanus TaxID=34020 RepID=UPI00339D983B
MIISETNNNYPNGNSPKTETPSPAPVQQKTFFEKAKECTKEAAISMIPVYGTIQEFKKGNYGWGIFGIISDATLLIPFVGYGIKAASGLIRGGSIAARIGEAGAVTAAKIGEEGVVTATKAGEASIATATKAGESSIVTAAKETSNLTKEATSLKGESTSTKTAMNEIRSESLPLGKDRFEIILPDTYPEIKKINTNYYYDYKIIELEKGKVYKNLADAKNTSTFIIGKENIANGNAASMLEKLRTSLSETPQLVKLISCFAHENIFNQPFTKKFLTFKDKEAYQLYDPVYSYRFSVIDKKTVACSIKEVGNIRFKGTDVKGIYSTYGIRADGFIFTDAPGKLTYSYYVK